MRSQLHIANQSNNQARGALGANENLYHLHRTWSAHDDDADA
jgi:hypothetical protein